MSNMDELHTVLRAMGAAIARLEVKVDALREDRQEDRTYLMSVSARVGKMEKRKLWVAGWAAGAAAVMSIILGPVVAFIKGVLP